MKEVKIKKNVLGGTITITCDTWKETLDMYKVIDTILLRRLDRL